MAPLRPEDQQHRDNLTAMSGYLRKAGKPQWAATADLILTPAGTDLVRRLNADTDARTPMSIRMSADLRASIVAAGEEEARQGGETTQLLLSRIVDAGFQRWLDDDFEVLLEPRAPKGEAPEVSTLSIRPNTDLYATVAKRCREQKKPAHLRGRSVAPSNLAGAILSAHFKVGPYAPEAGPLPVVRQWTQVYMRADYWAAVKAGIEAAGWERDDVTALLEAGIRRFLDGAFELRVEDRTPGQAGYRPSFFLDEGLVARLQERFEEMRGDLGVPGFTRAKYVIAAVLFEHFGIGPYAPDAGA